MQDIEKTKKPAKKVKKSGFFKKNLFWVGITFGATIIIVGLVLSYFLAIHHDVVAKFPGGSITKEEYTNVLRFEAGKFDPLIWKDPVRSMEVKTEILKGLVRDRLLMKKAQEMGITTDDKELQAEIASFKSGYTDDTFAKMLEAKGIDYKQWVDRKRDKMIVDKLVKTDVIDKIVISNEDIQKYYNEHSQDFDHSEQVRARHILVSTWDEAEAIQKELAAGGNFAVIAKEKSISPERWKEGDLGYFSRGTYPEVFDNVCFTLPSGETSQTVKSDYGYHIFKLIDKRGPAKETIEEAKPYIISQIQRERSNDAFNKWYDSMYKDVSISINKDILQKIEVEAHEENN